MNIDLKGRWQHGKRFTAKYTCYRGHITEGVVMLIGAFKLDRAVCAQLRIESPICCVPMPGRTSIDRLVIAPGRAHRSFYMRMLEGRGQTG